MLTFRKARAGSPKGLVEGGCCRGFLDHWPYKGGKQCRLTAKAVDISDADQQHAAKPQLSLLPPTLETATFYLDRRGEVKGGSIWRNATLIASRRKRNSLSRSTQLFVERCQTHRG